MERWDLPWVVIGLAFVGVLFAAEWERWVECRTDADCRPTPLNNGTCIENDCACGSEPYWKCNPDYVHAWTGLDIAAWVLGACTLAALIFRCVITHPTKPKSTHVPPKKQQVAGYLAAFFATTALACFIALVVHSETVDCYTDDVTCPALLGTSFFSFLFSVAFITQI